MRKTFMVAALAAAAAIAFASAPAALGADTQINWTLPNARTDGTAMPASEIAGFDLAYGVCLAGGLPAAPVVVRVPGAVTGAGVTGLGGGTWCFSVRTVDTKGVLSAYTLPVQLVVPVAPPNPPSNVKVTLTTVAYELRSYSNGTFRFVQVGTVQKGVQCGPDLAGGFALFDGAKITKPTTGGAIAAKCG